MDVEGERGVGVSSVDSLEIIKASGDMCSNASPPGKLLIENPSTLSSIDEEDADLEAKMKGADDHEAEGPPAEVETDREHGNGDGLPLSVDAEGSTRSSDLYKEKGEMRQRRSREDIPIPVQTQTKNCDKEGHICFDCFPIPDKLLDQLRRQTGMDKLACLQTVQTVVKFYKQDLVCSKYFACEASDDYDEVSDYSHSEGGNDSSAFLFRATPKPLRRQRGLADVHLTTNVPAPRKYDHVKFKAPPPTATTIENGYASSEPTFGPVPTRQTRPSLKLCIADKFRNMVRTLRLESGRWDWDDPRNVSFFFTFFSKLNKVVANLDTQTLKRLIAEDDFGIIWIMARFLRKEKRWSIEWEILGVLGIIAARDSRSRKRLLDSNFPGYLARVIQDPYVESEKLGAYAELLTVLLSGGRPLEVEVMEHLDIDFISLILDMIEFNASCSGWVLHDVLVKLLLAYNMQFDSGNIYSNITVLAISRLGDCNLLTSRLIEWLENKDSPLTKPWEVSVSVHQCVIKMITDIFLCRTTSHLFSIEQSVGLMTLLTKGLTAFRPGDKRRTSYLKLIQTVLRHCKYDYVRNNPSMDYLQEILCEKTELAYHDKAVIRSIFKEFPQVKPQLEESYDF